MTPHKKTRPTPPSVHGRRPCWCSERDAYFRGPRAFPVVYGASTWLAAERL